VVSTQQPPESNHHDTFIENSSDEETAVKVEKLEEGPRKKEVPSCEFC
jgi:hypothetical protein